MSFSFKVKQELYVSCNDYNKIRACFYGLLVFCNTFCKDEILLQTESQAVAEAFISFADKLLKKTGVVTSDKINKKKNIHYTLTISDKDDIKRIYDLYSLTLDDSCKININAIGKKKYISSFVAGAFMACGSINDPLKEYHFEFVLSDERLADELSVILEGFSINTKKSVRKNYNIVYIKESENIEDILTFMGATKASLELMNVKILKDVRNKTNRAVNCDSANIEKAVNAAQRQIIDINIIKEKMGLKKLPQPLYDIAVLRLSHPDYNLKELADSLTPPISRSGANHRLTKLHNIADELNRQ